MNVNGPGPEVPVGKNGQSKSITSTVRLFRTYFTSTPELRVQLESFKTKKSEVIYSLAPLILYSTEYTVYVILYYRRTF